MTSERELEALAPSCGPANSLDNATLLTVLVECAGRSALHGTEVLHARVIECRDELARRLQPARVPEGWRIHRDRFVSGIIHIRTPDGRICVSAAGDSKMAGILFDLADALLAAAPAPEADQAKGELAQLVAKWRDENGDYPEAKRDCADELERAIAPAAEREVCGKETGTTCANPKCYVCTQYAGTAKHEAGQREGVELLPKLVEAAEEFAESIRVDDFGTRKWTIGPPGLQAIARRLASAQQAGANPPVRIGMIGHVSKSKEELAAALQMVAQRTGSRGEGEG